jgi:hypothetical protein
VNLISPFNFPIQFKILGSPLILFFFFKFGPHSHNWIFFLFLILLYMSHVDAQRHGVVGVTTKLFGLGSLGNLSVLVLS